MAERIWTNQTILKHLIATWNFELWLINIILVIESSCDAMSTRLNISLEAAFGKKGIVDAQPGKFPIHFSKLDENSTIMRYYICAIKLVITQSLKSLFYVLFSTLWGPPIQVQIQKRCALGTAVWPSDNRSYQYSATSFENWSIHILIFESNIIWSILQSYLRLADMYFTFYYY